MRWIHVRLRENGYCAQLLAGNLWPSRETHGVKENVHRTHSCACCCLGYALAINEEYYR